jgi:signal transduction histidine kinase
MTPGSPSRSGTWLGRGIVGSARGLAFCGLMLAGTGLLLALTGAMAATVLIYRRIIFDHTGPSNGLQLGLILVATCVVLCVGRFALPAGLQAMRSLADLTRRLAGEWCGVPVASPYRPLPAGQVSFRRWLSWLLSDRATWRDLQWMAVNMCAGWLLAVLPAALVVVGLVEFIGPAAGPPFAIPPPAFPGNSRPVLIAAGIALITLGLGVAPSLLRAYGGLARSMLAPTRQAELALRVRHLAQTRSDTIDSGAAELRRIERDLHDGAQARLVAMGMTLSAAEDLLDDNPAAARALLAEARDSSARALAELRDLVRGILPPVLADRGLADAVRALALDSPLRAHLATELAGRPPAPVESAAYFAVSELLANVSKHAEAGQVWIDIRHEQGTLRIGVSDDGRGGAEPADGTGLRGIERRVAAFDGVLALSSPPGGPTVVNMEIPCALSSPKTSSC